MRESKKDMILRIINDSSIAIEPNLLFEKLKFSDMTKFLELITQLQKEGRIIVTKKGKLVSARSSGLIPAKIISQSKMFAFARPIDGGEAIFIFAENMKTAILGDTVMLCKPKRTDKGLSAEVKSVIAKGNRMITGTVERWHNGCEIVPDVAFRYNIPVLRGGMLGARDGDKVQAVLSCSPRRKELSARIIKVYGKAESAKICSDAIIDENDIPYIFPKTVLDEAEMVVNRKITDKEIKNRIDLRNELIFTIDSENAKDLDDAISIKKIDIGWELGVHIADVSYYVKENGNLDMEARLRGTSVYFADRVIPMLPQSLSNGVCSLNANEDKLTFSAIMKIDSKGNLLYYEFVKSIINSKVRGVYSEINSILNNTATNEVKQKYNIIIESILEAQKFAKALEAKAEQRGNMDIETSESKFKLNEDGICIDVSPRVQGESERIIEQCMIMANQAAALYAKSAQIPFMYRVHETPNPERVKDLRNIANALGLNTIRINETSRAADFAKLLDNAKDMSVSKIISNQVLRTMSKAKYSPNPLGHFGLSLDDYCHFTSPIRRYPDTVIHRILTDLVAGVSINKIEHKYNEFVFEASKSSSYCEIRALKAERDAEKCYMAEYMTQHIGEIFDGVISGVTQRGIFVQLLNSVEGFISISLYENNNFKFDGFLSHVDKENNRKLTIGDNVRVKVISACISAGLIDFAPIDE